MRYVLPELDMQVSAEVVLKHFLVRIGMLPRTFCLNGQALAAGRADQFAQPRGGHPGADCAVARDRHHLPALYAGVVRAGLALVPLIGPVSYTHLTLPTNREV